jgi:DNA-binding NarL/FixJ family response regulator
MRKITVLLCDDHNLVREGLRFVLAEAGDIQVVGEADNGHQAVREAERLRPDVVVLDIAMPLLNGVEAARQITKKVPATKILILSGYSDERHIVQAIEAGASGYLMKQTAGNDFLRAVREIQKGNAFFSPSVTKGLLPRMRTTPSTGYPILSSREVEVLQLVAEGYANKQIADLLSLSVKTVEKHRQTLMEHLNIHNIAALTHYAVSSGVIECLACPVPTPQANRR